MPIISYKDLPHSNALLAVKPYFTASLCEGKVYTVFSDYSGVAGHYIETIGSKCTEITVAWAKQLGVVNHGSVVNHDSIKQTTPLSKDFSGSVISYPRIDVIPYSCNVYGVLNGDNWQQYKNTGVVNNQQLPPMLKENNPLSYPLFIPESFEDGQPLTFATLIGKLGKKQAEEIRRACVQIFEKARKNLTPQGMELMQTTLHFGIDSNENLFVIGELLTPRNSTICRSEQLIPGRVPTTFSNINSTDSSDSMKQAEPDILKIYSELLDLI